MPCSIRRRPLFLLLTALFPALGLAAETAPRLESIVVTATRTEQSAFDLPVAIDSLNQAQLQDGQLQVNLSEAMARIPGIVAQNRQNYAQDLQISSRGFGARASFGVRGLRLYADGIPATMPDGQGQVSHFDLGSAARLEVMRGPFSSLYGNSSGGVISLFTENGEPGFKATPSATFGSYGTERLGTKFSGDNGMLNYLVDVSSFRTDGYRDHSAAKRDSLNGKLRARPDDDSSLTLVLNSVDMPDIQDPLGITRSQYQANPQQVDPVANAFNTRKSVGQQQLGLSYERKFGAGERLNATIYRGHRDTIQYQAIPVAAQAAASHPGGVIDLGRDYWGIDARWTHRDELAGRPWTTTLGLNYDKLDEARKGFQNFIGTQTGVLGALRRNEDNRISSFDQYIQTQWVPSSQWLLLAGLRHSAVKVVTQDKYIVGINLDDSGATDFSAVTPVLGATWHASEAINLYASYGKGFETPTVNELAYRRNGAGLNFALQAAKSENVELGLKARLGHYGKASVAVFEVRTDNEIAVDTNTGGRTTYRNAGRTQRSGLEASWSTDWDSGLGVALAYTYLTARYGDTVSGSTILAGNFIPGIPRQTIYAEGSWQHRPSGFGAALEIRSVGKAWANDANSDAAESYTIANIRLGLEQQGGKWRFNEFLRLDNLGDRKYSGSVIVNEGNSRFFEPAPGRNWLVGVSGAYTF
jgi:iron complex outermembrane receptor protein